MIEKPSSSIKLSWFKTKFWNLITTEGKPTRMTRVAGGFVDNQWKRWGRQNCGNEQRSFRCRNQLSKQPLLKTCTATQFDQWYQPHATWNLTSHTFKSKRIPMLDFAEFYCQHRTKRDESPLNQRALLPGIFSNASNLRMRGITTRYDLYLICTAKCVFTFFCTKQVHKQLLTIKILQACQMSVTNEQKSD